MNLKYRSLLLILIILLTLYVFASNFLSNDDQKKQKQVKIVTTTSEKPVVKQHVEDDKVLLDKHEDEFDKLRKKEEAQEEEDNTFDPGDHVADTTLKPDGEKDLKLAEEEPVLVEKVQETTGEPISKTNQETAKPNIQNKKPSNPNQEENLIPTKKIEPIVSDLEQNKEKSPKEEVLESVQKPTTLKMEQDLIEREPQEENNEEKNAPVEKGAKKRSEWDQKFLGISDDENEIVEKGINEFHSKKSSKERQANDEMEKEAAQVLFPTKGVKRSINSTQKIVAMEEIPTKKYVQQTTTVPEPKLPSIIATTTQKYNILQHHPDEINAKTNVAVQTNSIIGQNDKPNAICTLIYNPLFIAGAQVLAYSVNKWRKPEDNIQLCALLSHEAKMHHLHIFSLESLGYRIIRVPEIVPVRSGGNKKLFTKLNVWNLTEYNSVLFLDADALTVKNVKDLFTIQAPFAASRDWGANGEFQENFNGGVLLVRPNKQEFDRLLQLLNANDQEFDESGAEQGWLNSVYKDNWFELSFFNNVFMAFYSKNQDLWNSIRPYIRIYHMAPDKAFVERSFITKDHDNFNLWYGYWYGMIQNTGSNFTFVTSITCADKDVRGLTEQSSAKPIVIYDLCQGRKLPPASKDVFFAKFDGCNLDEKIQLYWEENKAKFPKLETLFFELCKPYLLYQVALANPFRSYLTFWLESSQDFAKIRNQMDDWWSTKLKLREPWQKDLSLVFLNVGAESETQPACTIDLYGGTVDAISLHYDSYKGVYGQHDTIIGWFNGTKKALDYRQMQLCLLPGYSHVAKQSSTRDGSVHIISTTYSYYMTESRLSQCHQRKCAFAKQSNRK